MWRVPFSGGEQVVRQSTLSIFLKPKIFFSVVLGWQNSQSYSLQIHTRATWPRSVSPKNFGDDESLRWGQVVTRLRRMVFTPVELPKPNHLTPCRWRRWRQSRGKASGRSCTIKSLLFHQRALVWRVGRGLQFHRNVCRVTLGLTVLREGTFASCCLRPWGVSWIF